MYTILMSEKDKSLITTVRHTLHQREHLCDTLQFLFPTHYDGYDLKKCTVFLKYKDLGNVAHVEVLKMDEELYKDKYIRCTLPVDSQLNRFASDVFIRISFMTLVNKESVYILHTDEAKITIEPVDDYFEYANSKDGSLEVLDSLLVSKLQPEKDLDGYDVIDLDNPEEWEINSDVIDFENGIYIN